MEKSPQSHDHYQVFFYTCPAHRPFSFAIHPWVVTVSKGVTTRWEVIHREYKGKERYGYVYKNFYTNPSQGIKKHSFSSEYWEAKLIGSLNGDEKSTAKQVIDFIEKMTPFYPHQENYSLYPGPNSNTYIAWILGNFPELNIRLPWNAFGKNFK